MPNRLAQATSPYLRQHAENPVEWYEWGAEAWRKALAENKPVFLSVGYSSCHWCHVMAHESFEDPEVAEALNRDFVSIKLDREDRPDIDDLYMTAVQLATGHGGWPMSVFLTPSAEPFFAGTYFPKLSVSSHPGFLPIVQQLASAWRERESEVREQAAAFAEALTQALERSIPPVSDRITPGLLDLAVQAIQQDFDTVNGGFGTQPKFPAFATLRFLLSYAESRNQLPHPPDSLVEDAGYMALFTLEKMALGGIRDHVGGGFHRYSTDERWLLPHFEKMLSDQAQMIELYDLGAALADDAGLREFLTEVANHTVEFVERELKVGPAYASALDADTDGAEGQTYVWRFDEFNHLVAPSLTERYQIRQEGNYFDEASGQLTAQNIPHLAERFLPDPAMDKLLAKRRMRPQPGRDDKQLLASNALLSSALARRGESEQARAILQPWINRLPQVAHQLSADEPAFLDGYAYLANALLDLGDNDLADQVINLMVDTFADGRGFTFSGRHHEPLLGRQKPFLDQSTPNPNGLAIAALRRRGRISEAVEHISAALGWVQRAPQATGTLLQECLQLLLLGAEQHGLAQESPAISAHLEPDAPAVGVDGFAYSSLIIRIPNGFHINGNDPSADWLVPAQIHVEGAYAEAAFPPNGGEQLKGESHIELRLKPRSESSSSFQVTLTFQCCSETECYAPQSITAEGRFRLPGQR